MKIGIIKEGKVPPDSRVPLTPQQCASIQEKLPVDIVVQPSPTRCFPDEAYREAGVPMSEDLSDCDILMGVKEVPIKQLQSGKTYFMFSHTIKKQPYNQQLLWAIMDKNIQLIDYEVLTNEKGQRLIAFGKFAGMVGAHNALWTYGQRTKAYHLPRMNELLDYEEALTVYKQLRLPAVRVVLTGTGRVATGAQKVLLDMGLQQVSPENYLSKSFDYAVFTQLDCKDYAERIDGTLFDLTDFFQRPDRYKSIFAPYAPVSDILINGIFWDKRAPAFFTLPEMASPLFNIQAIADVTCDIAPEASIPSTVRASTIANPVFGFDPKTRKETPAFLPTGVDMMTIDNLPNELPRDASKAFGEQFIEHILPELLKEKSDVIERATITEDGILGPHFQYLADYAGSV